jgi:hypothetical protein
VSPKSLQSRQSACPPCCYTDNANDKALIGEAASNLVVTQISRDSASRCEIRNVAHTDSMAIS